MKHLTYVLLIAALVTMSGSVNARNTILQLSIEEALNVPKAEGKLDDAIQLFFGNQEHPAVERKIGTWTANKKTNAVGKTDTFACQWAFLSAMISLQERAAREGGDAVVNIRSYYYKNDFSSPTEFECGAGAIMAGVTMVGDVVKLAE